MAKGSDNDFPSILFTEQASAPTTPAAGKRRIYWKTDNKFYVRDESGTETEIGAASGTIGGSSGSTDNAIIRADGTGGVTIQSSLAAVDDSGGINIPTGQTYNINGSPHTHAGGSTNYVPLTGTALTAPTAVSGFTWINQESATATEADSVVRLSSPSETGAHLHALVKAKSQPYTITIRILPAFYANYTLGGIALRQSSDGKLVTFGPTYDAGYLITSGHWNSATSGFGYYVTENMSPWFPSWFQIQEDGTTLYYRWSVDGVTWKLHTSHSRTDFMTVDQAGYFIANYSGTSPVYAMTLASWVEA